MEQNGREDGDVNTNVIVYSIVEYIIVRSYVMYKNKHHHLVHFHHYLFNLALAVLNNSMQTDLLVKMKWKLAIIHAANHWDVVINALSNVI